MVNTLPSQGNIHGFKSHTGHHKDLNEPAKGSFYKVGVLMELIINEYNLKENEIEETISKVRAILVDENERILIANYGNVILLPGGKIDNKETIFDAIKRELNEEIGQQYDNLELNLFCKLNHYQKNYLQRNGTHKNRLVKTYYFIGTYKEIRKESQKLTKKEQTDNFKLQLISLNEIENIILNNQSNNPRNIYFQQELLTIIKIYKEIKQNIIIKKLKY